MSYPLFIQMSPVDGEKIGWPDTETWPMAVELCKQGAIQKLCISSIKRSDFLGPKSTGLSSRDISFLRELKETEFRLTIPDATKYDLEVIYDLKKLTFMSLGEKVPTFDFTKLTDEIRCLYLSWMKHNQLPSNPNLEELRIRSYSPACKNLSEMPIYPHLRYLEFVQGNLESLHGIENLSNLERFEYHYGKYLQSIENLNKLSKIRHVMLHNCKKIKDVEMLSACPNLEILGYSHCGKLKSLSFIKDFPSLKDLRFVDTLIEDGDMTPLMKLQSVGFLDKRSYSHTSDEIKSLIRAAA